MRPQVLFRLPMGNEAKDILVVMVTASNQEEAARIADQSVQSRQAACATTVPMVYSTYWWEGKVVREQEAMVFLKTTAEKYPMLRETIQRIHSYKVPEILAMPVADGLTQYLEWVREETS